MVGLVPPEKSKGANRWLAWIPSSHLLPFLPLSRLPRRGEDHVVLHDGVLGGLIHVEVGELVAQLLQLGKFSRGVTPAKQRFTSCECVLNK